MAKKKKWEHVLVSPETKARIESIHAETGVSRQRIADEMMTYGLDARDAVKSEVAKSTQPEMSNGG
jgi:hypothetical protein